ncbi:LPXTG cell wall anchor domain-containing protein [Actinoplanes sp. NPDC051851]|uniref:LPXTG cell wall anchor domain-containing protein n=1 Tax=Actinoplanes sp. NPDC051851 TaxID=3154753 RepID=UPI0034264DCE
MPVLSSLRRRGTLMSTAAVSMVAAIVTLTPGVAEASSTLNGSPTCNCVVQNSKNNTYRAVYGYVNNSSSTTTIAAGSNNKLSLSGGTSSTDDDVTTTFKPGTHTATWATGWLSKGTTATWTVGGQSVSANWNKQTCGSDVSLPASGNGTGPLIALVGAGLIAGFVFWRKRRKAAQ